MSAAPLAPSLLDRATLQYRGLTDDEIDACLLEPADQLEEEMDAADSEERLIDFIKFTWSYVVPGRPFVRNWVIEGICEHLEAVTRGEIRRLIMNVPPGFMKSLATDVFWPAWEWGPQNKPHLQYIAASYSQDLTIRDNVRTRQVIAGPRYQRWWGDRFHFTDDQNAKQKFGNNRLGFKVATSVHGMGTGERGDRVIIDDAHNVLQAESDAHRNGALQWFTEVMPTRVNDIRSTAFVVIGQRVHENDVTGLIFEKELGYTSFVVPMHYDPDHTYTKIKPWVGWRGDPRKVDGELAFPELYPEEEIQAQSKVMMAWGGTYAVAGQMEQRPEPRGGGMCQLIWFEIVDEVPPGPHNRCRGWDFASTEGGDEAGSASVLTVEVALENDVTDLYVEHAWFDRVSPGVLREHVKATCEADGYDVFQSLPQDPGQAGKYQVNDMLEIFAGYDFEFSLESGDKVARFRPIAAQAETRFKVGRRIKLVRGDWNVPFLSQVTKFPMGKHKDLPDAWSRSYGGIVRRGGGTFLIGGSTIVHRGGADGSTSSN